MQRIDSIGVALRALPQSSRLASKKRGAKPHSPSFEQLDSFAPFQIAGTFLIVPRCKVRVKKKVRGGTNGGAVTAEEKLLSNVSRGDGVENKP